MHTQSQRIVLTTFGSFGDLNPFIALACGLQARGHQPMIATSAYYRDVIEAAGISLHAVQPDLDPQDKSLLHRAMHPPRGTEVIIRAIVFALGSAALHTAGNFYRMAVKAALQLKKRAVLVVGQDTDNLPRSGLPQDMVAVDYAPYSKLFPEAFVIVHQGGIGTTGQALQACKPTLVVPFAQNQPDNARRLERLGISQTLPFKRCSVRGMARALKVLTENQSFSARAAMIGQKVRTEDGVAAACVAIEALLSTKLN